jgi:hypothetical protein
VVGRNRLTVGGPPASRPRLPAQVLQHLPPCPGELVDDLDHLHRKADRADLAGHGAGDERRSLAGPFGVTCLGLASVSGGSEVAGR